MALSSFLPRLSPAMDGGPAFAALLAITILLIGLVGYLAINAVYSAFFHPLRRYPGPKLWAASKIPWIYSRLNGRLHNDVLAIHKRYKSSVVRVGPNELSYTTGTAWKTIYGHRQVEMSKTGSAQPVNGVHSIITSDRPTHTRHRRLLAHAFSEKALREQEGFFQHYIDLLIARLGAHQQEKLDMVKLFNFTTFDLIGDLAFGEPFGCLEGGEYHPFVAGIFNSIKAIPFEQACLYFGVNKSWFMPKSLANARAKNAHRCYDTVDERMAKDVDRKDFLSYILQENDEKGLTRGEIHSNSAILILAGSETTATLLSGALFCLLTNPTTYARLTGEVRTAFASAADITLLAVAKLEYLQAVLEEALRMYPPVPSTLLRVVPPGGETIDGLYVPGGTAVGVHQYSAHHSPDNFFKADDFLPERWLAGTKGLGPFMHDDYSAVQPFSTGPRNCLGKNLAYAEMRLILARLLWTFDVELEEESRGWLKQSSYVLWEKPQLMCRLKSVQRD